MDLDLRRVLAARPGEPTNEALAPLTTPWGEGLDAASVRGEHPRPTLERAEWTSLNGWWDYAIRESSDARRLWRTTRPPRTWDGRILVPFSPEAALSGVGRQLLPCQLLWYRRELAVGELRPGTRTLLHFEAVDYACALYVNGGLVATHVGGYLPLDADVTDALRPGANVVELCVHDPSERGTQPRGKQRLRRGNMWYTAQSGIWQPVWMEVVPERHIATLDVDASADEGTLVAHVGVSAGQDVVSVDVLDARGAVVAQAEAVPEPPEEGDEGLPRVATCVLRVPSPHLWEPDDPYLYGLRVAYGPDEASGYCAFRTVGVEPDEAGVPRFCLNHRPLFVRGLLDQGMWPDGLLTAPSDEAMAVDIRTARELGFNMLRKHIKTEPERWYWHCDRLGMLVWQDMVSGGDVPGKWVSAHVPTLLRHTWALVPDTPPALWDLMGAGDVRYREEWLATARATVRRLGAHPCVAAWVAFNESWGQFDSVAACEAIREADGTRPVVAASGWYDQGAGDFQAVHNYFRGMRVYRDGHAPWWGLGRRTRAFLINETGGLTCPVAGHTSVATAYGYDAYEDLPSWRDALARLLAELDALEPKGLSGFVYTQLTDVEEETNGLLTYDRRVCKAR